MANTPGGDELVRSSYKRAWIQRGGPRPSNPVRYGGADGAYIEVGDLAQPVRGGITRDQVHDPYQIGAYRTTAVIEAPPDFATNSVMFRNKRGVLPWLEVGAQCEYNLYEPSGYCRNPADFSGGWETGVTVYSKGRTTNRQRQGGAKFSEDVVSMTQADTTWTGGVYDIGTLSFGEQATAEVTRQIVDVAYASAYECGRCGPGNDGTKWRYALQQDDGASTGIKASVIYTTDGGATFSTSTITTLAGNDTVVALDVMGGYLIVLSDTGNAYHYAPIDDLTGAVGAWTAVTSGFVALKLPRDIWVAGPTYAIIVGDDGYVYELDGVGNAVAVLNAGNATTEDLRRVDGVDSTVVAVGTSGAVIVSSDRGITWATTQSSLGVADTVQAVSVLDAYLWWVGTAAGNLYYTETGGASWSTRSFSGSGAGQIYDIVAATFEVIYVSHSTATPDARILASITGGAVFDLSTLTNQRRLKGLPTFDIANRLAVPRTGAIGSKANHLLIGGLAGNGTDGILLHGAAAYDFSS
jgi:hypothetical protein